MLLSFNVTVAKVLKMKTYSLVLYKDLKIPNPVIKQLAIFTAKTDKEAKAKSLQYLQAAERVKPTDIAMLSSCESNGAIKTILYNTVEFLDY